jgi:hypothetical protein
MTMSGSRDLIALFVWKMYGKKNSVSITNTPEAQTNNYSLI